MPLQQKCYMKCYIKHAAATKMLHEMLHQKSENKGENMKAKLPFKTTFRFAMFGSFLTRVLTIFLCAFSFALVALASTGFLYNEADFLTRALLNYMANTTPSLDFCYHDLEAQDWRIPGWSASVKKRGSTSYIIMIIP